MPAPGINGVIVWRLEPESMLIASGEVLLKHGSVGKCGDVLLRCGG